MTEIIRLEQVTVYIEQVCALDRIDLSIGRGDFLGIVGPNGGGKTTLLKVLLGLVKPSAGRIICNPPSGDPLRLGYVPQFSRFDKDFPITVTEVVLMGRLVGRRRPVQKFNRQDRRLVRQVLEQLEIDDLQNRQIGQLSGGQLQRVLIARALAMEPDLLLLDEPTASLDTHYKTELNGLLENLNQKATIVLVTHDLGMLVSGVNKVACLNQKLFYHGSEWNEDSLLRHIYGCPQLQSDH
ncbi:MAG: ATP-binding cassette domain-containing protein [Bacillota bacterium]|jgi:zinc transport system ATP-binding protein